MPEEINSNVSVQLDPEVFKSIDGYDTHAQFVGGIVNAVSDAHRTLADLYAARDAAHRDRTLTPEARVLEVGRAAEKQQKRLLRAMELAARDLDATIRHTEGLLSEPLTQQAALGSMNAEVRAHVKALPAQKRAAFVSELLARDDDASLQAVLGGQFFLSGLSEVEQDHFVRRYHEKRNPQLVARLDTLNRFREMFERVPRVIELQMERVVGDKLANVAALGAVHDRTRALLNGLPQA